MSMMPKVSGFTAAVEGIRKQGERVAASTEAMNRAFTAAQNALAADSVHISNKAAVIPAVEDAVRGAVLAPEGEVTTALVDILQAKSAYKANVAALKVSTDLEESIIKAMDREV